MPNPHTTAERVVRNSGFPSVTVESPAYPKKAAAEEVEGGFFRELAQWSLPQETSLNWHLCLILFSNSIFEETQSQ